MGLATSLSVREMVLRYKNRSLARLFDSLVRVSRRVEAPHFQRQVLSITEKNSLAAPGIFYVQDADLKPFTSARFTGTPVLHFVYTARSLRVRTG